METLARHGREWRGSYFDGQVAQRHAVTVEVQGWGLLLSLEGGGAREWPYAEIRSAGHAAAEGEVRLERGPDPPEVLVVADTAFLEAVAAAAPPLYRARFERRSSRSLGMRRALALTGVVVAVAVSFYLWMVPLLAARVAALVPLEWEEDLGAGLVEQITSEARVCDDPERVRALEAIVQRLASASPVGPYRFRLTIVDDSTVNAMAAPGGYIVIYQGLLEQAETPDEVAGVLAHEMQHVIQRHGTTAVLKEIPLRLAAMAVSGNDAVAGSVLGAATALGALRYRRGDEEAADREGMRMLRAARISPQGMIAFFGKLEERGGDTPAALAYLSTHPSTRARVEALTRLAAEVTYAPEPVLPGYDWSRVRAPCDAA